MIVSRKNSAKRREILAELTALDERLYAEGRRLFETPRSTNVLAYDEAAFEQRFAAQAVWDLRPECRDGETVFRASDRLLASGLHGRDGIGDDCRVWTGPSPRSTVYFPVPAGYELDVKVWINAYVAPRLREQLRVEFDDLRVEHRFESSEDSRDVLVVRVNPERTFGKLTMTVDETLDAGDLGETGDHRKRGVQFDSYGRRIV
ncbi:MAG: hypothetical protein QM811_04535 [Pirellulales bacterium]